MQMSATPIRKKLIEVSIPLEAINAASEREKDVKVREAHFDPPVVRAEAIGNLPRDYFFATCRRPVFLAGPLSDRGKTEMRKDADCMGLSKI